MEIHPAADIFPLDEGSIPDLAEDIRKNGLLTPIERFNGQLLDGRRRMRACALAGVEPRFKDVTPSDPVAYVLSLNLHRRHLTPSQLAMVGARARECYDQAAKERQKESTVKAGKASGAKRRGEPNVVENLSPRSAPESGKARDQVAKAVGVSGPTIDFATKVLKEAAPELVKAVDEGRVAVSRAAKLVDEPHEKQVAEATTAERCYRKPKPAPEPEEYAPPAKPPKLLGVGVILANEAINCLIRIPKDDPLRAQARRIITDWIKANM